MGRNNAIQAAALAADPEKAERVATELERLRGLFADADENKKDYIRDAVQQLAWLGITILELQADIDERGPVVPYQNGKGQSGLQANPACKILKDYQQLHNTLFRALLPVLPERPHTKSLDLLRMEFEPEPRTTEEIEAAERAEDEKRKRIDAEIAAAQKLLEERRTKLQVQS